MCNITVAYYIKVISEKENENYKLTGIANIIDYAPLGCFYNAPNESRYRTQYGDVTFNFIIAR